LGLVTCKNSRLYNLYCVGGDVKPCSINQLVNQAHAKECEQECRTVSSNYYWSGGTERTLVWRLAIITH